MTISIPCALVLALGMTPTDSAKPLPFPAKRVKDVTYCIKSTSVEGVVEKIDEDGLTLVEIKDDGRIVREHQFVPIDLFRKGEVIPNNLIAHHTYRWQDVKRGDTVELQVKEDREDGLWYCLEIYIMRRPKGTLPESQDPKRDVSYWLRRVVNEFENGEEVSNEDILKAWPPRPEKKFGSGTVIPADPGGLPRDYQAKLDAIRAKKKDNDLKAPPTEKK